MAQLMLLFQVGAERYALETTSVVEIIHRVELSKIQGSAAADGLPAMAGRFNYHGQIVGVLDLTQLLGGGTSRSALGTRIVLVRLMSANGLAEKEQRLIGLLVEQVTATLESHQFDRIARDSSDHDQPAYFGETLLYQQEMIQSIRPEYLLGDRPYETLLPALPPHSEVKIGAVIG